MQTVLITGANRGLGLEFTRQYLAGGWQVLATSRRSCSELAALGRDAGSKLRQFRLDVGDHAAIDALAAELADVNIDLLLNNAGYLGRVPFASGGADAQAFGRMDYTDWEQTLRINVLAPMKMTEAFVEHVARSSDRKIITLTSMLGSMQLNTTGGLYGYRSSKAAVNAVMRSLSIDLAGRGILAVAVHPGWARTDMGGPRADIDASESVSGLRKFIGELTAAHLGKVWAWNGEALPY